MQTVTLAYLRNNGRILALHGGREEYFLQDLMNDQQFVDHYNLSDVDELSLVITEVDTQTFSPSEYYVSAGELKPHHQIILSTDAQDEENPNGVPEIAGDGKSTCEITAEIVDAEGKVNQKYSGDVKFQTARGKLSTRNGIVKAKKGLAKIVLTSAPETVPPFEVRAEADGCTVGILQLEFF